MVASCRVNRVMSLSLILPPDLNFSFLTVTLLIPWRRRVAWTTDSLAARISPRTDLPSRLFPSHWKVFCLTAGTLGLAVVAMLGLPV